MMVNVDHGAGRVESHGIGNYITETKLYFAGMDVTMLVLN